MEGHIYLKKHKNNSIFGEFIRIFGGRFLIDPDDDILFYTDTEQNAYILEKDEIEFLNKLTQSVKEKKNLLLNNEKYRDDLL